MFGNDNAFSSTVVPLVEICYFQFMIYTAWFIVLALSLGHLEIRHVICCITSQFDNINIT